MSKASAIEKADLKLMNDAFKTLDEMNPEATFLDQNSLSNVTEWIDTGSMALNTIISGSVYGGVPMGRLTAFIGPESCGKTFIINKIMANAQKKGMSVAYFDTEGALDSVTAERLGCDVSRIKHCPVEVTEKCRNQIVKFLNSIIEKKLFGKVLIAIDSVGNLITAQEKKKMDEGNEAPDMGNRAKACLCPNTLITTDKGIKKLSDISIGDKVLTHLGRFRNVIDKWETTHTSYLKIKTKNSEILLSKNHRLLVKRGDRLIYIEAQRIKKTDKLLKISSEILKM